MKKMWKRFVSLLLACTPAGRYAALSASAAEKPTNNKWVQEKVEALNAELGDESHQYELDGWAPIPEVIYLQDSIREAILLQMKEKSAQR